MIRTLIIEDEEPAALRLEKLLKEIDPDIEILSVIDTIDSAVKWIENNPKPDLIMLDIQLGDGLSFEIFRKTKVDSYIIFTTAYDEYAIKAFELNSIDYLLKPIDETRLSQSLRKFKKFRSPEHQFDVLNLIETIEKRKNIFKKRFVVTIAGKIKIIEAGEVAYFYSKEKNTFLCTADNHHFPLEFSLDHLEQMVDPEQYFRVSRQYLVNYRNITKIDILSKSRIRIETMPKTVEEILVSSSRTPEFRSWLDR
jgi:DNA-binding LytR/AlgR family response regulator